jgi:hypothetical protein
MCNCKECEKARDDYSSADKEFRKMIAPEMERFKKLESEYEAKCSRLYQKIVGKADSKMMDLYNAHVKSR